MEGAIVAMILSLSMIILMAGGAGAWTGEIHGRVICDVCGDSSIGPEDHVLEGSCKPTMQLVGHGLVSLETSLLEQGKGAEVAVLCITRSGDVLNYQAFTNSKGIYTVAETMPESDRWDACMARPISSFHQHCTQLREGNSGGVKFSYTRPSGYSHTVRPFVYRQPNAPTYCF